MKKEYDFSKGKRGAYNFERNDRPTTPGEILDKEFLQPLKITQQQLAEHIGCDVKVIGCIVGSKLAVNAQMALKLGATLNTTSEFWLSAQVAIDLFEARQTVGRLPKPIFEES